MGVNSLPKTVTRQRRGCDLNPGPSAPESSTLTTRLPSHPFPVPILPARSAGTCCWTLICIEFVYLYFPVLFCLSVSVKRLAVKTASEMTYTVSSDGALNSAPTNPTMLDAKIPASAHLQLQRQHL